MHHVVYQSVAFGNQNSSELKALLRQARVNNVKTGITGLLLYCDGNFLQVLEGERETVHHLFGLIKNDFRHTSIVTLADGAVERRIFTDWTMGFQSLSGEDYSRLMGYINPFRAGFLDTRLPPIDESVLWLLKTFVQMEYPRL